MNHRGYWVVAVLILLIGCSSGDTKVSTADSADSIFVDVAKTDLVDVVVQETAKPDLAVEPDSSTPDLATLEDVGSDLSTPDSTADLGNQPDIDYSQPPILKNCDGLTYSNNTAKLSYLAIDKTATGIIPKEDTAGGVKFYRNPLAKNELVKTYLDNVNTALANALDGTINGQQTKTGPLVIALELQSDDQPLTIFSETFPLAAYGGYMRTYVQGIDPFCGYREDDITTENICLYDLDLVSFVTPAESCLPRFLIDGVKMGPTPHGLEYISGSKGEVHLVLPIAEKPVVLDIFDVELDVTLQNAKDQIPGVFLGFGFNAPNGIIAGIVCTDQLSTLINAVQDFVPGSPVDFEPVLEGVAKQIASDPQFKVDPDPCNTVTRQSKGIPIVLRFRAIPARLGIVKQTVE